MRKTFWAPALLAAFAMLALPACSNEETEKENLCSGKTCPDGQTCNPDTGLCEGGGTTVDLCEGVVCEVEGETCNPATGKCQSGPVVNPNPPECGNNVQEPGEECDGGEDCDATCHLIVVSESCAELSISGSDACELTGSGSKLLVRGDILTADKVIENGSVLIGANGVIECVGCDCSAEGAQVITCPNAVVSPALINAHEHIGYANARPDSWGAERFDHRNDWRKNKNGHTNHNGDPTSNNLVGEMRMIMGGSVTLFGSVGGAGDLDGLMRNVDSSGLDEGLNLGTNKNPVYDTFPLGDSSGKQIALGGGCSGYKPSNKAKSFIADYGCPYGPHVAEGINSYALNELYCVSGQDKDGIDLFNEKAAFIHGVGATPEYISMMAEKGVKLIWSPRSNISLYGDTAQVTTYDRLGVTIGMGTDWIYSGSMNMLRELQCIDYLNKNHYGSYFSDKKIWMMATINNAIALGVENKLGDLKVGLLGDIAVFRTTEDKQDYRAVIDAAAQDVLLVTRGRLVLYGDANLVADSTCESEDVCGSAKKICAKASASSMTYAKIKEVAKYDLFSCGVPEDEPTCVPQRTRSVDTEGTTNYTGETSATDSDGDGIPDSEDNCPTIFNPVRPDSAGKQGDYDNDNIGDACDAYPTCKDNNETCPTTVDPAARDTDSDGVVDREDNCVEVSNAEQTDSDEDGKGDACDDCPEDANPGDDRCPLKEVTAIEDIQEDKDGSIATQCGSALEGACTTNKEVLIEGVVSAIVPDKGFFVQNPASEDGEYAGIYVYTGSTPSVSLHDEVSVQAYVGTYYTMVQMTGTPMVKVLSHDHAPARAWAVQAGDVATGGAKAKAFNSVLVKVEDVVVTTAADKNFVFVVEDASGTVKIDDFVGYKGNPTVGDAYSSITGVLVWDWNDSKIAPRTANDLVAGEAKARLTSLDCPEKLRQGASGTCTVSLARAVSEGTTVQLTGDTGVGARSVTISAGDTSAEFDVTMAADATDALTVKAYLDDVTNALTATISPVGTDVRPTAATVTGPATAQVGSSVELTITLDNPSANAFELTLRTQSCGTVTSPLSVKAEELTATATLDTTGCAVDDVVTITAAPTVDVAGFSDGSHTLTIVDVPAETIETFDGSNDRTEPASSYKDGSFTSTATGITWTYVGARVDEGISDGDYAIDGDGLLFKAGSVSGTVTGGVGKLSVEFMAAYSNTSNTRRVKLLVNDSECGSGTSTALSEGVKKITCENVNASGDVAVKVVTEGSSQVIIDNLAWTPYN